MDDIRRLAALVCEYNRISDEIAALIRRPALAGHVGEFIAAKVFDIQLSSSAAQRSLDGHFKSGAIANRSVNVKWYGKHEGLLDIMSEALPDFYLLLSGPRPLTATSRGGVRPWCIEHVHLFDAVALTVNLRTRGVKIGTATSVAGALWRAAEIYPEPISEAYRLTDEQRSLLKLFSMRGGPFDCVIADPEAIHKL